LDEPRPGGLGRRGETLLFKQGSRFVREEPPKRRGELGHPILPDIYDEGHLEGVVTIMDVVLIGAIGGGGFTGATISDLEHLPPA
jgi:hypothetical protein